MVSKLSPWLSLGCLSPREVYWKMKEAEAKFGARLFCKQVLQGLLWRDYYRFMLKKYGNTFFKPAGFNKNASPKGENPEALQAWKSAATSQNLVNLHMKELNETGYINSAARILLATYFVYELKLNWVLGAAYFEEKLIDYTPASNWGNWANVAGVGNDEKLTNDYCFTKQLKFFDPKAVEA
jgi:deoxyribodipyrimidine photo-lyase